MDCLLLDQTIGQDARITGKTLSVKSVDYEKAYGRVPNEWLMTVMKAINCQSWIQRSIKFFSKHWATVLELRMARKVVKSTPVKYNKGLFRGDSLSPLLLYPKFLAEPRDILSGIMEKGILYHTCCICMILRLILHTISLEK